MIIFPSGVHVKSVCQEDSLLSRQGLWNPVDLGYLTTYVTHHLIAGDIKGEVGEKFNAGRLGDYEIGEGGVVLLGPPFEFDKSNVDEFSF